MNYFIIFALCAVVSCTLSLFIYNGVMLLIGAIAQKFEKRRRRRFSSEEGNIINKNEKGQINPFLAKIMYYDALDRTERTLSALNERGNAA